MFKKIESIDDIIDEKIRSEKLLANACHIVLSNIGRTIWPKECQRINEILKEKFTKEEKRVQIYCSWSKGHYTNNIEFNLRLNSYRTRDANTGLGVVVDWKPTEKAKTVIARLQKRIEDTPQTIEWFEKIRAEIPKARELRKKMIEAKKKYEDINYKTRSYVEHEKSLFQDNW